MNYVKLPNGNKIECYDYFISDHCEFRFIKNEMKFVKAFFSDLIIDYIDVVDENDSIVQSCKSQMKLRLTSSENVTIITYREKVIKEAYEETVVVREAYDEEVIDPETNEVSIVHHESETRTVKHPAQTIQEPSEKSVVMVTALLETPSIDEEIDYVKKAAGIVDLNTLSLDEYKSYLISQSKSGLQKYLLEHPLESSCHGGVSKLYAITEDKQSLMMLNYTTYQIAKKRDAATVLTWNESGEACEIWTEEEFLQLIAETKGVVEPLVSYQQHLEKEIQEKTALEDLKSIIIDYSSGDMRNKGVKRSKSKKTS